jgi:hypothetical protein
MEDSEPDVETVRDAETAGVAVLETVADSVERSESTRALLPITDAPAIDQCDSPSIEMAAFVAERTISPGETIPVDDSAPAFSSIRSVMLMHSSSHRQIRKLW